MRFFDIFRIDAIKEENEQLKQKLQALGADEYFQVKSRIDSINSQIVVNNNIIDEQTTRKLNLSEENEKLNKQINTQIKKLSRIKELYKSIDYSINNFFNSNFPTSSYLIPKNDLDEVESISPSVILKLHSIDIKDLRKAYNENDKQITKLLETYSSRYTTKANQAIYQLMVIALRAELQNILYNLKYQKLNQAVDDVKRTTAKYLKIAGDGNQNISGTLTKFIGEVEYLFINSVKIEYNYYVKKEQAKQEQLALRQKIREEAEERKRLEEARKKVELEESKYESEISKAKDLLASATDNKQIYDLQQKIEELQNQLTGVVLKKDEISNLQNGKAGNVYIISNLGSFGKNIFKIGMTRRLNPQERVDELGSASVPFRFDVHSMIFSDDAVDLENKIHTMLNDKRVNKVNLRKEFFNISIDELEQLVNDLDPSAEFNKTMLAEEFRQSQSSNELYTNNTTLNFEEDDYSRI